MDVKIILLVVENRDFILTEYAKWLTIMMASNKLYAIFFADGKRKAVWFERRRLIEKALKTDCTHILFVDSDVFPEDGFLEKLLDRKADMISGVYYFQDGKPCSVKDDEFYKGKGLQEVDVFAMGLSLIKREVLEKVQYPQPKPIEKIDADTEFCKLVKKKGFKIMQDFNIRGNHLLLGIY